mmetsp:Transcript_11424/g.24536  ORF Transcript_11424/g.24536 Transcript_11424/m.24536 type:complete len:275 (-) Transcript_11424:574-1398(-)
MHVRGAVGAGRHGAPAQLRGVRHHERLLPRAVPPQRRPPGGVVDPGDGALGHDGLAIREGGDAQRDRALRGWPLRLRHGLVRLRQRPRRRPATGGRGQEGQGRHHHPAARLGRSRRAGPQGAQGGGQGVRARRQQEGVQGDSPGGRHPGRRHQLRHRQGHHRSGAQGAVLGPERGLRHGWRPAPKGEPGHHVVCDEAIAHRVRGRHAARRDEDPQDRHGQDFAPREAGGASQVGGRRTRGVSGGGIARVGLQQRHAGGVQPPAGPGGFRLVRRH